MFLKKYIFQKLHIMFPVGLINDYDDLCYFKGKFQYSSFDANGDLKVQWHYAIKNLSIIIVYISAVEIYNGKYVSITRFYPNVNGYSINIKVKVEYIKTWELNLMKGL